MILSKLTDCHGFFIILFYLFFQIFFQIVMFKAACGSYGLKNLETKRMDDVLLPLSPGQHCPWV